MIGMTMISFNNVTTESEWNRAFCKSLIDECGADIFACVASERQTPGFPDRYISHPLFSGWVECKRSGNSLSKLQERICKRLNQHQPGTAWVLWLNDDLPLHPESLQWFDPGGNVWRSVIVEQCNRPIELLKQLNHYQRRERIRNHGANVR